MPAAQPGPRPGAPSVCGPPVALAGRPGAAVRVLWGGGAPGSREQALPRGQGWRVLELAGGQCYEDTSWATGVLWVSRPPTSSVCRWDQDGPVTVLPSRVSCPVGCFLLSTPVAVWLRLHLSWKTNA